jgi:hypothetical protein
VSVRDSRLLPLRKKMPGLKLQTEGVRMTVSAYSRTERRSTSLWPGATDHLGASRFSDRTDQSNAGQGWLLFQRADEAGSSGVYYPEALKSMRTAFNLAWKHVSPMFDDQERARQTLAVQILYHLDRGEHRVGRLATSAADDLIALTSTPDRPPLRNHSASAKESVRSFVHYRALRRV